MFNKNRKTKKSLLISTYECLISHYNFIENNNNLYLYGKKIKLKKIYQVTPNNIRTALVLLNKDYLATDSNTKILYAILKVSATKFVLKNLFLHVLVLTKILFILIHLMKINL